MYKRGKKLQSKRKKVFTDTEYIQKKTFTVNNRLAIYKTHPITRSTVQLESTCRI